jgi:quinol monooxygenase YgiN
MPKLALIAAIETAPGHRDHLLSSLLAHRTRSLRDEPGTLQLEVLASLDDDTKVLTYEVYRDVAAFEVHRSGPSLARWREETAGMIVTFSSTRCTLLEPASER